MLRTCDLPACYFCICYTCWVLFCLQTTPFDSDPLELSDEPPQAAAVPIVANILAPSPSNDMLSTKLAAAEDKVTLLEKEKQRIQHVRNTCVHNAQGSVSSYIVTHIMDAEIFVQILKSVWSLLFF